MNQWFPIEPADLNNRLPGCPLSLLYSRNFRHPVGRYFQDYLVLHQIIGYTIWEGRQIKSLKEIWEKTGVLVTTYSNLIRTARQQASENGNPDLCTEKDLAPLPNSINAANEALTPAEKEYLVATTLEDANHCQMTFSQLAQTGIYFILFNSIIYVH